ncbi:unnamed protein product [Protopolystoma xenopodis]|uniref:Uncharacterized protein n=1 Tax=Protopolystoma xenopodis TaxID=117903 RepID=A0A448XIJ6_9PLAT|nr:unnamed protein product [Protopolystoma xenopodis]
MSLGESLNRPIQFISIQQGQMELVPPGHVSNPPDTQFGARMSATKELECIWSRLGHEVKVTIKLAKELKRKPTEAAEFRMKLCPRKYDLIPPLNFALPAEVDNNAELALFNIFPVSKRASKVVPVPRRTLVPA